MLKSEALELVRELVDDPDGTRWKDRVLSLFLGSVLDELWGQLLAIAPYARHQNEQITTNGEGFYSLANLTERYFRILKVVRGDDVVLHPLTPQNVPLRGRTHIGPEKPGYVLFGDELLVLPQSTTVVDVWYSHRPPAFSALAANDVLPWPDGEEMSLLYEVAGRMLTKGGAEDPGMHLQIAQRAFQNTLGLVQRRYPAPLMIQASGSSVDWGGV
jgi:hypothetical protein